jgi:hypothetical protein
MSTQSEDINNTEMDEVDELVGLMSHSFLLDEVDNIKYVTELGKRLNLIVPIISSVPIQEHNMFLNELETFFRKIKQEYLDYDLDEIYSSSPRLLIQTKYIREMIRNFLMTNSSTLDFTLKFKYQFANQALIQLYFIAHELDNPDIRYNTDIHYYERPVTFYEYEM